MDSTSEPLPNKCKFCGLHVFEWHQAIGSASQSDNAFGQLHRLKKEGIIDSVPRRQLGATIGGIKLGEGTTEFCSVNASAWGNNTVKCKYWQLRIKDASLSDYLTIYHAHKNQEVAVGLAVLAIVITIVIAIIQLST